MPLQVISVWSSIDVVDALALAKDAAQAIKRHGASACTFGEQTTGADVGNIYFIATFDDYTTFGAAQDALAKDGQHQVVMQQALAKGTIVDRFILHTLDL